MIYYLIQVKDVGRMAKGKADATNDKIEELLLKLLKSVNIVVSLVNVCRIQRKASSPLLRNLLLGRE